jgi:hypothetical protein
VSYSVKLADEVIISGVSAIQPDYLFSHRRIIATNEQNDSQADASKLGNSTQVGFDLADYIGKKGLRFHDRSSKLILTAIKVLLDETGLLQRYPASEVCLVVGSDGALQSQNDVVREAMRSPKLVNPKAYPNRGCNVIAGQASLMFGLLGESTVVSSGYRSGIDALIYAVRKILVRSKPISYVVAAGEALSEPRTLRKKHKAYLETQPIPLIEGAVALSIEKASNFVPSNGATYQVIAYQQSQEPYSTPEMAIEEFLTPLGYSIDQVDQIIAGCEDALSVKTKTNSHLVPYDVFGATTLLQLSEIIGMTQQSRSDELPKTIVVSESDRYGYGSKVLLRRRICYNNSP